jgi:hypothetical protein
VRWLNRRASQARWEALVGAPLVVEIPEVGWYFSACGAERDQADERPVKERCSPPPASLERIEASRVGPTRRHSPFSA